jgi:hypothetical protein
MLHDAPGGATQRIMTQSAGTYTLDAGWFNLDHLVVTQ